MRVHVLTPGFTSPNGRAFLFPLVVWRRELAAAGIHVRFVADADHVGECDVLLVDSKYHRDRWMADVEGILADFADFRRQADKVIYCDTTDSSGWLQTELLPVVDRYWKFQLLRDRSRYLQPMYGHRIYADYYHRTCGATDVEPGWSNAVTDPLWLDKLDVAWNSGLADYSLYGPFRMAAYMRLPWRSFLAFPERAFVPVRRTRGNIVSCRFGANYPRASVAWQRQTIRRLLDHRLSTVKLSRRAYFRELADTRVVVSPFGFGEITLKDFEVFLTGGLLIKPDMSHLDTWPHLFQDGETMLAHSWDLDDVGAVIDHAVSHYDEVRAIAEAGQQAYRRHLASATGAQLFHDHLQALLAKS